MARAVLCPHRGMSPSTPTPPLRSPRTGHAGASAPAGRPQQHSSPECLRINEFTSKMIPACCVERPSSPSSSSANSSSRRSPGGVRGHTSGARYLPCTREGKRSGPYPHPRLLLRLAPDVMLSFPRCDGYPTASPLTGPLSSSTARCASASAHGGISSVGAHQLLLMQRVLEVSGPSRVQKDLPGRDRLRRTALAALSKPDARTSGALYWILSVREMSRCQRSPLLRLSHE